MFISNQYIKSTMTLAHMLFTNNNYNQVWGRLQIQRESFECEGFVQFQLEVKDVCGTLKCENAAICEKVAKCEKNSTLNVKIDAICEK